MDNINYQLMRHLLLRFCLGFILIWFGIQQVINPSEWTGFVPEIISSHSPVGGIGLIFVHGALLTIAAIGISVGLFPKSASLLAATLLLEIIVVLSVKGNSGGLIVRDIGLLVMALVLAIDQFPVLKLGIPQLVRRNPRQVR
jgi:uncharacterized membrane protein YphA (DoxX/SURF4 family)